MNKSELVEKIASKTGQSASSVDQTIGAMFEVVADAVSGGGDVSVPGWIKFERVATSARKGRNPQTGQEMQIPAGTRTKITAGSKLKAAGKS